MTDTDNALVPAMTDEEAVIQAFGFDKLNPAMRKVALAIANTYGLDPMLRHLVMVEGRPYITRDGLLHVAHKSGVFDGIEVTDPEVIEMPVGNAGATRKYWYSKATVYRKDMARSFTYPGRYPLDGQNGRYGAEMAIKVAEVMTLRRAFDVAAPVVEERWDTDGADDATVDEPANLQDRIAARAASIGAAEIVTGNPDSPLNQDDPVTGEPPATYEELASPEIDAALDAVPEPEWATPEEGEAFATAVAEAEAVEPEPEPANEPTTETASEPAEAAPTATAEDARRMSLADFREAVKDRDQKVVRQTAKRLFPDRSGFGDLDEVDLGGIMTELEAMDAEDAMIALAAGEPGEPILEPRTPAPIRPELCGSASPYGDGKTCARDAGHSGAHRGGVSTTW